jgi:hypothetical protein
MNQYSWKGQAQRIGKQGQYRIHLRLKERILRAKLGKGLNPSNFFSLSLGPKARLESRGKELMHGLIHCHIESIKNSNSFFLSKWGKAPIF